MPFSRFSSGVRASWAVLALAALSGCGSDGSDEAEASSFDGTWNGSSADFVVAGNRVTRFSISADFGPCRGTADDTTVNALIENGAFSFGFSGDGVSTTVSGSLAGNTATGTFGRIDFSVSCGNSFATGYGSGFDWSASKE